MEAVEAAFACSEDVGRGGFKVSPPVTGGRVLQVSVSPGGLPKLPVGRARVGRQGLDGDRHREDTIHGGPYRAVCLFGIEAIERLRAEGHPVEPGGVGENLTTVGVNWSTLPAGTRVRVGRDVLLELVSPAMPCDTQRPNFLRGEVNRISINLHPADSRMYARVLAEGEVRPGDPIALLAPAAGSDIETHLLLERIEASEREADLRVWRAALAGGAGVRIIDDEELVAAATPSVPDDVWNHALGLRTVPAVLPRALDHFRRSGTPGWFGTTDPPWAGAEPVAHFAFLAAVPGSIREPQPIREPGSIQEPGAVREPEPIEPAAAGDDRQVLRALDPSDAEALAGLVEPVVRGMGMLPDPWLRAVPGLLATRNLHVLGIEDGGRLVAAGMLSTHRRVGMLRSAMVVPEARGLGLQRRLIEARARLAEELGCQLVASSAVVDGASERNLVRMGMRRVWIRQVYCFDPADDPTSGGTEQAIGRHA